MDGHLRVVLDVAEPGRAVHAIDDDRLAIPDEPHGPGGRLPSGVTVVSHATSSVLSRRWTCSVSSNAMAPVFHGPSRPRERRPRDA